MTSVSFRSLFVLAAAVPVAAQEFDMSPAKELQRYTCMLGTWEGSGIVVMAPGAPKMPWRMRNTCEWSLNGHFVREHGTVTFEGGDVPPMEMTSYYGWDRETGTYSSIGASSMGNVALTPVHWTGETELVAVSSGSSEGKPYADRAMWHYDGETYTFTMHRTEGNAEPFLHVQGKFTRVKTDPTSAAARDASAGDATHPEIAKLQPLVGTWNVKGEMVAAPGQPKTPIAGVESCRFGFGGQVVASHVAGEPAPGMPPYEMVSFIGWDAAHKAYDQVYVDNMGQIGKSEMWWVGDKLIGAVAGAYMGTPAAGRMVLELGNGGSPFKVYSDRFFGAGAAIRDFEATYTRAK